MQNDKETIKKVKEQINKKKTPVNQEELSFNGKKLIKGGSSANKIEKTVAVGAITEDFDSAIEAVVAPKLKQSTFVRDIPVGSVEIDGQKTKLYKDSSDHREFYYSVLEHGSKMRVYI